MELLTFKSFKEQIKKLFPHFHEEVEIHAANLTESAWEFITILYIAKFGYDDPNEHIVEYETSGCFYYHSQKIIGVGKTLSDAIEDHRVKAKSNLSFLSMSKS
jgi:hypothetical protein